MSAADAAIARLGSGSSKNMLSGMSTIKYPCSAAALAVCWIVRAELRPVDIAATPNGKGLVLPGRFTGTS
jgi:hypothetical protein